MCRARLTRAIIFCICREPNGSGQPVEVGQTYWYLVILGTIKGEVFYLRLVILFSDLGLGHAGDRCGQIGILHSVRACRSWVAILCQNPVYRPWDLYAHVLVVVIAIEWRCQHDEHQ